MSEQPDQNAPEDPAGGEPVAEEAPPADSEGGPAGADLVEAEDADDEDDPSADTEDEQPGFPEAEPDDTPEHQDDEATSPDGQ